MKILVTVKRVADYEAKLKVRSDQKGVELDGVNMIMNPFDEIAVEEALRLKEKHGGEVIVLSVGPDEAKQQLRSAMAMGADSAILVKSDNDLDSLSLSSIFQKVIEEETPNLVLMGKQAIDDDAHQVAEMTAERMGWGQATQANSISIDSDKATVVREADGGLETLEVDMPCIVSTDLRLNEPRYASLPGIMKAKRKPLKEMDASAMGVELSPCEELISLRVPSSKKAGEVVSDVASLVEKLKNEAKVL